MYIDAFTLFSDAQALTATAYSTNTIDLGNVTPKNEIGAGEPLTVAFQIDVAADGTTTDETYEFRFIQSANANLSSEDALVARIITYANLTVGTIHFIDIPPGCVTKRYIGAKYVLGGTTPTVTVTSWLTLRSMIQRYQSYAKGYTIS